MTITVAAWFTNGRTLNTCLLESPLPRRVSGCRTRRRWRVEAVHVVRMSSRTKLWTPCGDQKNPTGVILVGSVGSVGSVKRAVG